jgi:flagella basal body P-ring formation protein FlgA
MDEGARGDTIRVVNVQTKRTIEAQVVGPDTVMVVAAARSALVN